MAFRFRKSIKIMPGVKLNVTKKGLSSTSIGKKGATINLSTKGAKGTVGIPGTGLSYQTDKSTSPLLFWLIVAVIALIIYLKV